MTVTLKIEKTVYGGDGLGRLGDGRVAFVPGAYAGETVKAEIVEQKKRFVKTRLVSVEEAIPERLTETGPTVPGMVYADVAYAAEIRFKQDPSGKSRTRCCRWMSFPPPRRSPTATRWCTTPSASTASGCSATARNQTTA